MDLMHDGYGAKRHYLNQVPNALLRAVPIGALISAMSNIPRSAFRDALVWHMDRAGVTIPELAKGTGVTKDTIKKLRTRPDASTIVVNAVLIANYFGMSVERFLRMEPETNESQLKELAELLLPEEERLVEAQVRGILRARGKQ